MKIKYLFFTVFGLCICLSCCELGAKSIKLKLIDLDKVRRPRTETIQEYADKEICLIKLDRFHGIDDFFLTT